MSAPVGPAGIAALCSEEELEAAAQEALSSGSTHRPRPPAPMYWHLGASGGYFASQLIFSGAPQSSIEEYAVTVGLEYRPRGRWSYQISAGAILDGGVTVDQVRYRFSPGWLYSASTTYRVLDGVGRWQPFVFGNLGVSASATQTAPPGGTPRETFVAMDIGLTVMVGKTFWRVLSPYVMGRVFGGPILWRYQGHDQLGSDLYHFQLGAGVVVTPTRWLDLYFEGVPLGEQRLAAGVGLSF